MREQYTYNETHRESICDWFSVLYLEDPKCVTCQKSLDRQDQAVWGGKRRVAPKDGCHPFQLSKLAGLSQQTRIWLQSTDPERMGCQQHGKPSLLG
jgi:hypothetical protein